MKTKISREELRHQILNQLRSEHKEYAERVKLAIESLSDQELDDEDVRTCFEDRLHSTRAMQTIQVGASRLKITSEDLAEKLNVSHSVIEQLENSNGRGEYRNKRIFRYYLEVMSLILNVSPLYLIGKTDYSGQYSLDDGYDPMCFYDECIVVRSEHIIKSLIDDIEILKDVSKFSSYTKDHRTAIKQHLMSSPKFETARIRTDSIPRDSRIDMDFEMAYMSKRKIILESNEALMYLGIKDFELLDKLAYLVSDSEVLHHEYNYMKWAGYFEKSNFLGKLTKKREK